MFVSDKIGLKNGKNGKAAFAKCPIKKGEVLLEFERNFIKHTTRTSLQISENSHQESTDPKAIENFLNHSCNPNGYINFRDLTFRALRNIRKNEGVTFNYLTTEDYMIENFKCRCGSKKCFNEINSFKYLKLVQKRRLEPLLSPFLKKKLERESEGKDNK